MEYVLSGKPVAKLIRQTLKSIIGEHGLRPRMILIILGSDPAADYYVQNIVSLGTKLNCQIELVSLPENTSQSELIAMIEQANLDPSVHGIMIQKPLPKHIDDNEIGLAVSPDKDIDSLNPLNLGKILLQMDGFLPCTALAVLCVLKHYQIPVTGKHVVIIGRSAIVGKPLANMLLWKSDIANASVTVCHSRSQNLPELVRSADIVVAAVGKPGFVTVDMIKNNSILIDVGINEVTDSEGNAIYVGDIDYNSCHDKVLAITPVPGGIGTVTSSLLLLNLVRASLLCAGLNKSIDELLALIFSEK
jgi:methylenetetrahydrofolate dehydrogenase (NADP+)/methenyltetrahydrofolate cyclohydrolase